MSDEPVFPNIPDVGDVIDRKKRFVEKKHTVIKCGSCQADFSRIFQAGDFVFKKLTDEDCEKCHKNKALTIVEIYMEWIDPNKK